MYQVYVCGFDNATVRLNTKSSALSCHQWLALCCKEIISCVGTYIRTYERTISCYGLPVYALVVIVLHL